ncbi:DNA polymerase III subunit beta [bacterium endosymbiont of Pedicinus badii]|uniref:DNA polymerase III subunit beta n=1 Tax=bacterium endosymbiont of Pedicinus badii TaxID=1719126 RepID=UPI0009BA24A0|nr:DNA polymerase III subunit beta [bacterium endosymbiont of Pedicinus badii]OQM34074.1 hypothetical protein AOQ89_01820 [bacterium endosymbiont of Pedicinus badii]
MKIDITKSDLLQPLRKVVSIISKKSVIPELENLFIEVENYEMYIKSTSLDMEIVAKIFLKKKYKKKVFSIPGKKFFDIFRFLSEKQKITIRVEKKKISIFSNGSSYTLSICKTKNFSNIELIGEKKVFFISCKKLKNLIQYTYFAIGKSDSRYYLNGMLFEIKNKEICVVATDGHRLAYFLDTIENTNIKEKFIVPRVSIMEIYKIVENSEKIVEFQIFKSSIKMSIEKLVFSFKTISMEYPKYHSVFPKNPNRFLYINCSEFKKALKRVLIISCENFQNTRFLLKKNKLEIISENFSTESAKEILNVKYIGYPIEMGFNVNYLIEIINTIKCKEIKISITNEHSSIKIQNEEEKNLLYLLMPIYL